ncbi:MAG: thiamine-phosphate kinase, partial [Burkholderiaceae bacterium]
MTEFELIAHYFDRPLRRTRPGIRMGIGDDCALLAPRAGYELAVSTDMLVAGRHFFPDVDPAALGWKALAVNLSDLAAMGAGPLAFTLALALPDADEEWLSGFASGLFECADRFDCALVGGDTTRGPLAICITIFGEVPEGRGGGGVGGGGRGGRGGGGGGGGGGGRAACCVVMARARETTSGCSVKLAMPRLHWRARAQRMGRVPTTRRSTMR